MTSVDVWKGSAHQDRARQKHPKKATHNIKTSPQLPLSPRFGACTYLCAEAGLSGALLDLMAGNNKSAGRREAQRDEHELMNTHLANSPNQETKKPPVNMRMYMGIV
jgi:hypothetical protein